MNVLVIVPRVNLVRDLSQRTGGSIYCATLGEKTIGKVTVATKQSLGEIEAEILILDEVHQYTEEFLETLKFKFIIGFTATPFRNDGWIYNE
jgi:superfamily II DNA or RNA helicase